MKLKNIAQIRTGLVISRKKSISPDNQSYQYSLINLKCINDKGFIDIKATETFFSKQKLKADYITQKGDILVRLSVPYTAINIAEDKQCGFVIPSHFAIIRVNLELAKPDYIVWLLNRKQTKYKIIQNMSGSSGFGTISSGFLGKINIDLLPLDKQALISKIFKAQEREHQLLTELIQQKQQYSKACLEKVYKTLKGE